MFYHIPSRRPADSAPAVDSASAEKQSVDGGLVIGPTWDGTHEQELVEHELTVIEVAFGETVGLFEVKRRDQFTIYDFRLGKYSAKVSIVIFSTFALSTFHSFFFNLYGANWKWMLTTLPAVVTSKYGFSEISPYFAAS